MFKHCNFKQCTHLPSLTHHLPYLTSLIYPIYPPSSVVTFLWILNIIPKEQLCCLSLALSKHTASLVLGKILCSWLEFWTLYPKIDFSTWALSCPNTPSTASLLLGEILCSCLDLWALNVPSATKQGSLQQRHPFADLTCLISFWTLYPFSKSAVYWLDKAFLLACPQIWWKAVQTTGD